MNEMQRLLSTVRQAAEHYSMIEEDDVIAVGLSGGKDSIALLAALNELRRFYPAKFKICGITIDMGFESETNPFDEIRGYCEEKNIPYHVEKTALKQIVFDERKEKNPCSLCAKLRRGALVDCVKRLGANKLALGHHLDDAAETFMMTLLYEGRIGCYSPVTVYEDKGISVIRPLLYTREADIKSIVKKEKLPVVESMCPEDGNSKREEVKTEIRELEKTNKGLKKRIIGALEKRKLDGWY